MLKSHISAYKSLSRSLNHYHCFYSPISASSNNKKITWCETGGDTKRPLKQELKTVNLFWQRALSLTSLLESDPRSYRIWTGPDVRSSTLSSCCRKPN